MNENQRKLFTELYKFIHDEKLNCSNFIGMIEVTFPEEEEDEISRNLRIFIKRYLEARRDFGAHAMELMYYLSEVIKKNETIPSGKLSTDEGS